MISVIIPTFNAAGYLDAQLSALLHQTTKNLEILIIDSSSSDATLEIARSHNVRAMVIPKDEFEHGGTRTLAGKQANGELLVYLTQDAMPVNECAIQYLLRPLYEDRNVGVTYGRQIPYYKATVFAKHLRSFNYPGTSYIRTLADKPTYGIKTAFCSNSFAAYRRDALENVGWFKEKLILGEDMHVCAKMLLKGFKLGYVSEAMVYHSHNYSLSEEFRRYFDTGVFHKTEKWLLEEFGNPAGEGIRHLRSEVSFLISNGFFYLLPLSLLRNFLKLLGYKLGYHYDSLPGGIVKQLSMHREWVRKWRQVRN